MLERGRPTLGFYLAFLPPLLFAADMVWENTALSWNHGPQMIGFTLMHTVGIILFPAILASLIWACAVVFVPIFTRRWRLGNLLGALLIVLVLGIASLPYGFWIKAFASRVAAGPYAADFLVYMSALGQRSAVEALLAHGVPVDASDRRGLRAIEAAENAKQTEMHAYLLSRGAAR